MVKPYPDHYEINHRQKSVDFARGRLEHGKRLLGSVLLPDLTEGAICSYMKVRLKEGSSGCTSGRTINMELANCPAQSESRGPFCGRRCGNWKSGRTWVRALSPEEETRLLNAIIAENSPNRSQTLATIVRVAFGKPTPADPTKPITDISGAWNGLRKRADVQCRLHDLRHTVATKMAEAGVPESPMVALMGHMSRAMLERYSHIRMAAKREAVEALSTVGRVKKPDNSEALPTKVPTVADAAKIQYA